MLVRVSTYTLSDLGKQSFVQACYFHFGCRPKALIKVCVGVHVLQYLCRQRVCVLTSACLTKIHARVSLQTIFLCGSECGSMDAVNVLRKKPRMQGKSVGSIPRAMNWKHRNLRPRNVFPGTFLFDRSLGRKRTRLRLLRTDRVRGKVIGI